jgi:delta-1-pyrroline-5-carboxylate synthetase
VVTRNDGKLALGRLGALCEQVKELMSEGKEVILVTSGAVGVGRHKLRHQRLMNSRSAKTPDGVRWKALCSNRAEWPHGSI